MIDPRRHVLGASCFLLAAVLLFGYDFVDRGRHFQPPPASAKMDRAGVYDLSQARMLTRVVGHVRSHYVAPVRVDPRDMAVAALRAVQAGVPEVIVRVERDGGDRAQVLEITVADEEKRFDLRRVGDLYELNWKLMDVFDFLQRNLPPTADLEDIEYTAVNGLLDTLDPHSVLVTPEVYRDMQMGTQGRFGGLGIVISVRDGLLTVMSVMDGTPADAAGLRSGDSIVQIGEESTINMRLNEAVNRLRGEPGTDITIWIERQGWAEPRDFTITREEIRLRSVIHEDLGEGVGYVKIRNFQGTTFDDLQEALEKLQAADGGLKGLVMDLRNNPGGLLDQAIQVSDRFLDRGTIVTTVRERGKEREERHATRAGSLTDVPMVVLINRGSASASEIVAGALKHNNRALVMGTTSFGKGSVQVVYQIDDAALKLTIAQYLTPGDVSIQSVGIVPDVAIDRVHVSREEVDLHPDELDFEGEAGLKSHLESKKAKRVTPARRFKLLVDNGEDAPHPAGRGDDFRSDTLIELAGEVVRAAPAADRGKALVQVTGFLEKRQATEDEALAAELKELDVDWSRGGRGHAPTLDAHLALVPLGDGAESEDEGGRRLRAGRAARVVARVMNRGDRPAWRIHGVLQSEIAALDGEEVVFGRVDPGESRKWTTEVELPKSLPTQGDRVVLELYGDGRILDPQGEAFAVVDGVPRPRFAYTAQVLDGESNGDGLIQRGEEVGLEVRVTNVGDGGADDVLVTVKNESGEAVFIEKGRHSAGALARGESTTARFRLKVRETLKSQDVQLKLAIVDQKIRTWSQDDLSLPVFPNEFPPAKPEEWLGRVGTGPLPVHAGAHRDTHMVAEVGDGAVVPVRARAGEWVKVALAGEDGALPEGWVPADRLQRLAEGKADFGKVRTVLQHEPPLVELEPGVYENVVTEEDHVTVSGAARFTGDGRGRRYLYMFRNDDKVHFQAAAAAGDEELPFSAEVSLEEGRNAITVVARHGDGDVTRETLIVFRR
ncbi:MAG: MXAN_5808 family serine peptidase [Myxococcota bacterium]